MHEQLESIMRNHAMQIKIAERQRDRLLSAPPNEAVDFGIGKASDKKDVVQFQIRETFDSMIVLIEYGTTVALCSAFERIFRAALSNAVGEARSKVKAHYNVKVFKAVSENLIKEDSSFQGLHSKTEIIFPAMSVEDQNVLRHVREIRNAIVHGNKIPKGVTLTPQEISNILSKALKCIAV